MTNDNLPARNTEWQKSKQVGLPPPTLPDQTVVTYDPVGSDHDEGSGLDVTRLVAAVFRFKWLVPSLPTYVRHGARKELE